jgi:dipeptidyl aminopeptidase/acylaminoacyl peptidase
MLDLTTGKLVRLIVGERAIFFPIWNEDGSQIAFSERRQAWDDLRGAAIKTVRLSDLSERVLIPCIETRCQIQSWNGDRMLISGQLNDKSLDVYAVSVDSGKCVKATVGDMPLRTGVSGSKSCNSIAYIAQEKDRFHEVTVESEAAPAPIQITGYHSQVQSWPRLIQETVTWKTPDDHSVEGMLIDARSNAKTEKHPLIVLIHGGPASTTNAHNHFFHWYFEFLNPYPIRQWYEQGISIFMPDYRGSSGYGPELKEAIANRLGVLESGDILSGIDYLMAEYGFDPGRIGVTGPSYGGYLTMLLAAKYPSRFAAASAFAGWVDLRVQLYGSDGNLEAYACEDVWDPNKPCTFQSPLSYIGADCPPVLLQVGGVDGIVPAAQSLAFYRLLKKRGGKVKLVTYKNCGHVINRPRQLLAAQEHNLEWFTRWL